MLLPKLYNCRWTASTEQTTPVNFTCGKRIQAVEFTHSLWYVCKWNTRISTGGQEEETQHRPAGKGEYYRASISGGFRPLCLKLNTLYLRGRPRRKDLKPATSLVLDRRTGRVGHPAFTPLLNNRDLVWTDKHLLSSIMLEDISERWVCFLRTTASLRRAWAWHKLPPGLMENHKSGSSIGKPEGRKNPGPPSYEDAGAIELPFLMEFGRYGHSSQVVTPAWPLAPQNQSLCQWNRCYLYVSTAAVDTVPSS